MNDDDAKFSLALDAAEAEDNAKWTAWLNGAGPSPRQHAVKPVPPGCVEAPGYIIDMFDGSVWLTKEGKVTEHWNERGVWPTLEAVTEAKARFEAM